MTRRESSAFAWRRRLAAVVAGAVLVCTQVDVQAASSGSAAPSAQDERDYILYQVRPGEDPGKVARMFRITVDELLAANRISDPQRLVAGATLKIPDPRATRLAQMRTEKEAVERQLATAQTTIATLEKTIGSLEAQVADLSQAKKTLQRAETLFQTWRVVAFIAIAAAMAAAFGALLLWAKARDEAQRRRLAAKEADVLHVAVEKHRQLSGQFELKYQSLFHQVGLPATVQTRAQALRQAYDEDRARLDAIVAEAEREIKGTAAASSTAGATKRSKAQVTPLSAVRKNS